MSSTTVPTTRTNASGSEVSRSAARSSASSGAATAAARWSAFRQPEGRQPASRQRIVDRAPGQPVEHLRPFAPLRGVSPCLRSNSSDSSDTRSPVIWSAAGSSAGPSISSHALSRWAPSACSSRRRPPLISAAAAPAPARGPSRARAVLLREAAHHRSRIGSARDRGGRRRHRPARGPTVGVERAEQPARCDGGRGQRPLALHSPLQTLRSARARSANTASVTAMNGTGSGTVSSGIPISSAAVTSRVGAA